MNFLKRIQRAFLVVLAIPAVISSLPAQTNPTTLLWGAPVDGLQISVSLDTSAALPSQTPPLMLRIRNVGTGDRFVELGGGCGPIATSAIDLILMDSSGTSKRLTIADTSDCADEVARFTVPLPQGASFSTPIKLDSYKTFPISESGWQAGGTYTLLAELKMPVDHGAELFFIRGSSVAGTEAIRPRTALVRFTSGVRRDVITSNQIEIHFPAP